MPKPRETPVGAWLERSWDWLRWAFALWFFTGAFAVFGHTFFGQPVFPEVSPEAQALLDAFQASGFLYPLLAAVYLTGGALLFARRTTPLGLVILAAPVAVIVSFHIILTGMYTVAGLLLAGFALLCWRERGRFKCLWARGDVWEPQESAR